MQNRYIILRRVLPPFVLRHFQLCLSGLVKGGALKFGDRQAKRFIAHNERCTRFVQYHLVDLVRNVVAHNVKPSYTYFGGYKGGSVLTVCIDL